MFPKNSDCFVKLFQEAHTSRDEGVFVFSRYMFHKRVIAPRRLLGRLVYNRADEGSSFDRVRGAI